MRRSIRSLTSVIATLICSGCASGILAAEGVALPPFPAPLSPNLPYDVNIDQVRLLDREGKIEVAQRLFDILSWQAFVALNWPANPDGTPDKNKNMSDNITPRVWNYWRNSETIFLPDGAKPKPWGTPQDQLGDQALYLTKAAWRQHPNANQNFEAFSGPLVDQNGKWARYQVMVNHEEFEYLVSNELYNLDGQVAFSKRPENNQVDFPSDDPAAEKHGAIEIKLAWKEMGANDDKSRFFISKVKVVVSEPFKPGQTEPETKEIEAGLVGMHIAMRTRSSPEWIWSTFEQIDNVRVNKDAQGKDVRPNFYNPAQPQPVNVLPAKNAVLAANGSPVVTTNASLATTWIESLTTMPVQTARINVPTQGSLNPLDAQFIQDAAKLSVEVQSLLRDEKSVFQFYELIGTQWPVHPNAPAFAGGDNSAPESIAHKTPGDMVPTFLINTTMETYFQKGSQPAGPLEQDDRLPPGSPPIDNTIVIGTESCVGCHYSAGICLGFRIANGVKTPIFGENNHFGKTGGTNFSWLLQLEAKAKPLTAAEMAMSPAENKQPQKNPAAKMDISRFKERLKAITGGSAETR